MTVATDEESLRTYGEPMVYPVYPEGYFEKAEGSNYRNYGDDAGWQTILDVLGKPVDGQRTILEVGCAKGYFVKHAADRGFDAVGFDISEYAISKSVAPSRTLVWSAADPWPFGTETFDMVVGWEVMEHIFAADVPYVLREAHRVLRPSGKLILKIGGIHDDPGDHDDTHFTKRDRAWWDQQLVKSGFVRRLVDIQLHEELDEAFHGRDWAGRFFLTTKGRAPWRA